MLSGASISETVTILLCISVAIPMLLASGGCNEQRDAIPEEPRLSMIYDSALPEAAHHDQGRRGADTGNHSPTGAVDDERQYSALAWLQSRQNQNIHAAVANYRSDHGIRNRPADYGIIGEADPLQRHASPTLKF